MDLWKDLDRITTLLKNSPTKVIMLDFDGTLTPIVKFPEDVCLSEEVRDLLKNLSEKKGFYLAIISGRGLEDLKKRVNLQNIIYAGNHGLEGEIFDEKYLFPVPDKSLRILAEIQKQLNQITNKFKGTFIEDKGLTLSFHYRMADKHQTQEINLLIKQILKAYTADGLISVIAGKKVIDITPNVNWNKGSFAKLIINKIHTQTKKIPTVIFIGDDVTDEDVFQTLEDGITIRVGGGCQSNAKYNLKNTKEVFKFLEWVAISF